MEKKKEELTKLIIDLKEATKPLGLDSAIGKISRMDYINNKSINKSGLRKAEDDLRALDRWLSLYGTEKFGKCSMCGNEININRLLIMPARTCCIKNVHDVLKQLFTLKELSNKNGPRTG